jgi:mannitol-1-/sugar-/sorbitol-6-phosphatase
MVMAGGDSKTLNCSSTSVAVRGVLVDMDGVLISSTDADERCWLRWARAHGIEQGFPLKATHGRRAVDMIRALYPHLDPIAEARRLEDLDEQERDGIVVMPGAQKLLSSLPPASWTIVTSASEREMRGRLGFAGFPIPPRVISADSVTRGKPDPEPYLAGAALLGVPASECLVIEDAPSGIEAGRAAGCKVLAVLTSHVAKDLAGADWIVPSLLHVIATPTPGGIIQFWMAAPNSF